MATNTTDPGGGAGGAAGTRKRALIIGVDAYEHFKDPIGSVNDAVAIRDVLIRQAGMPAANIQTLISPTPDLDIPADIQAPPATREQIMTAFQTLVQQTQAGDEVVIYYAGHGARLGRGGDVQNTPDPNYHFSAICPVDIAPAGYNLVLNRELNKVINQLLAANATVTAIFDCCHSGGIATRGLGPADQPAPAVREAVFAPEQVDWAAIVAQANQAGPPPAPTARAIQMDESGWMLTVGQADQCIILSACRDTELANPYVYSNPVHGLLTYFLLDALRTLVPGETWSDLYPRLRATVTGQVHDQTPTLEGRPEHPVFGGQWTPYAPGFTVTTGAQAGTLSLDGGIIHGLGPGAQVAIYPPGTADFAQAEASGVLPVMASVDTATPVNSQAHVSQVDAGKVVDGARARLIRPSPKWAPLRAQLSNMPPAIRNGLDSAPQITAFVDLQPPPQGATVEVRSWTRNGQAGWAIVKTKQPSTTNPLTENDVIGFAPAAPALTDNDARDLGVRLGEGLVLWARYQGVLNLSNTDSALRGTLQLTLLASTDTTQLDVGNSVWSGPDAPVRGLTSGIAQVADVERMLLRLKIADDARTDLNVVVLLCSDDGNIQLLYDTGSNPVSASEERPIGVHGMNYFHMPFALEDPKTEMYLTFKAIAVQSGHPLEAASLNWTTTVQDMLDGNQARAIAEDDTPPKVLWTTAEVRVRITRQQNGS